jgi:hypothetical protein
MWSSFRNRRSTPRGAALCAAGVPGVVGGVLLLSAPGATAATWDFEPRLELGAVWDDNYRLDVQGAPQIQVGGAEADAQMGIRSVGPRSDLLITPRIHSTWFPNQPSEESTDGYVTADGTYHFLRGSIGGVASVYDVNVIYSELVPATFPNVQLGQPTGAGDSGHVNVHNRLHAVRLAPTYSHDLTQRTRLHLDAEYFKAKYDQTVVQQIGYWNAQAAVGMEFGVSPNSGVTVRATTSRYTPDVGEVTRHYGLQAEWNTRETQVMHYYFRLGTDHAQGVQNTNNSAFNWVGGAGVSWHFQITSLVLDALRSIEPSSIGSLQERDELRFRVNRALRPRLHGYVALRGIHASGALAGSSPTSVQDRDYVTGETGFEFQWRQSYRFTGFYTYTWQRYQGQPNATSNAVTVAIVWQPPNRFEPLVDPLNTY